MAETAPQTGKQLARALVEASNAHDVDRLVALFAADYQGSDVAEASPQKGPDGVRTTFRRYLAAFPDLHLSIDRIALDGSTLVIMWTGTGTHSGTYMRIPPTARQVVVRGVAVLTIDSGLVRRGTFIWDVAGFLRTIGLLPSL